MGEHQEWLRLIDIATVVAHLFQAVNQSTREGLGWRIRVKGYTAHSRDDEMLMSWQTGRSSTHPLCVCKGVEFFFFFFFPVYAGHLFRGNPKKVAYNPHRWPRAAHKTRRTNTKKPFRKLTWWASTTHLLCCVDRVQHPFFFSPQPNSTSSKGKLPSALAGKTSPTSIIRYIPSSDFYSANLRPFLHMRRAHLHHRHIIPEL